MLQALWKTKSGKLAVILFGCAAIFVWNPSYVAFSFRTIFGAAAFPLQNIVAFVGYYTGEVGSFVSSVGQLKRENENLLNENISLKAKNAALADQERENEALRIDAGLLPRDRYDFKAAEVIGRDIASSGSAILLNTGDVAGVRKGMAVVVGAGVLVGRIVETTPFSSRAVLISDSGSAVNAVSGVSEARGVVRGEFGLGLVLDMVLQSDIIKDGDTVITSGLGGDMPRGLLIGTVTTVESSPDGLFQRATLASPVRFDRLRFVSVVIKALP